MPNIKLQDWNAGYELIASWKHLGIKNKNYFVDSNSLELVEKAEVQGVEDQKVAANF